MRALRRAAALTALGVGLAAGSACSSFTDLDDFQRVEQGSPPLPGSGDRAFVETAPGAVVIEGLIGLGDPCWHVYARVQRNGRTITVRVNAIPGGACPAVIDAAQYQARVDGLSAGSYRVIVVHSGRAGVVFDGSVEVGG